MITKTSCAARVHEGDRVLRALDLRDDHAGRGLGKRDDAC